VIWIIWSLRYRSLTLALIANHGISLSGMVGGSKAELMGQTTSPCEEAVLPWIKLRKSADSVSLQVKLALDLLLKLRY